MAGMIRYTLFRRFYFGRISLNIIENCKILLPSKLSMFRSCCDMGYLVSGLGFSCHFYLVLPKTDYNSICKKTDFLVVEWVPLRKVDVEVLSRRKVSNFIAQLESLDFPFSSTFLYSLIEFVLKCGMFCSFGSGDLWSLQFQSLWLYFWRPTLLQSTKERKIFSSLRDYISSTTFLSFALMNIRRLDSIFLRQTCSIETYCVHKCDFMWVLRDWGSPVATFQ